MHDIIQGSTFIKETMILQGGSSCWSRRGRPHRLLVALVVIAVVACSSRLQLSLAVDSIDVVVDIAVVDCVQSMQSLALDCT